MSRVNFERFAARAVTAIGDAAKAKAEVAALRAKLADRERRIRLAKHEIDSYPYAFVTSRTREVLDLRRPLRRKS